MGDSCCGRRILRRFDLPHSFQGLHRLLPGYYGRIVPLVRSRNDFEVYLEKNLNGYMASQAVIETLILNQKESSRFLALFCERLAFHFREAKIISVGDHFGPARYADLIRSVSDGNCLPYLTRLDVSTIVVHPSLGERWPSFYDKFRAQLEEYGFRQYHCPGDNVAIVLRSDIKPSRQLVPA